MDRETTRKGLGRQGGSLVVDKSWDGRLLAASARAQVSFELGPAGLTIVVRAPFYNDPPPPDPAGELDGLWEYEVVELFLLGAAGRYLEVELGPHGHYLVLLMAGVRQVDKRLTPSHSAPLIMGSHWQTTLIVPDRELPLPFSHANAYAIHGQGAARCYQAAFAVPGPRPDFHQPRFFQPLP